jgi:predicted nucleic acid-binding protein
MCHIQVGKQRGERVAKKQLERAEKERQRATERAAKEEQRQAEKAARDQAREEKQKIMRHGLDDIDVVAAETRCRRTLQVLHRSARAVSVPPLVAVSSETVNVCN